MGRMKTDPNKQLMPLTMIPLRGSHSVAYLFADISYEIMKISNIARYHNKKKSSSH